MINLVVLGYGPIRMGEGAAAPFNGVHIMGEIQPTGGFDTLAECLSWPEKSTMPQSTVRGLFMVGELAVGWNGGPVCGDGY